MYNHLKLFLLSFTIIAVLVFSGFGTPARVLADGDTPPQSTETAPPVGDGSDPSVVTETQLPATDELPVVTETTLPAEQDPTAGIETPVPDNGPVEEANPAPESSVSDTQTVPLLEQLPDNTTVTVMDENGAVLPLTTQASSDAIASTYDPIWCPEGQSPTPGQNGCTGSFNSFNALLTFLKANETNATYQQAGTIYIQQGQYLGGESSVNFNNYNFNVLKNYNLTLHGGWDTSDNSTDAADTTQFNAPITIGSSTNPWIGSLTLYNMNISNVAGQTGLVLNTQGNISLNNVEVSSSLNGALLTAGGNVTVSDSNFDRNKNAGADINAGGNVQISSTSFNGNGSSSGNTGKGLEISNAKTVSLASVSANNNQVFGANISASGAVAVNDSFFAGNTSYTYHCKSKEATGGYGLQVVTADDISLDGVTASDNFLFGGHLAGNNVQVLNSSFNSNGSGSAGTPTGYGLKIEGSGMVYLDTIQANQNQLYGANIQTKDTVSILNSFFDGNQSYTYSCKGKKVNQGYGLQVVTTGTAVLSTVSASNNSQFGAILNGDNVVVYQGTFDNNEKGLKVQSTGNVALSNVDASLNQAFGADVAAAGDVAINNSFFSGQKTYTYDCRGRIKSVSGGGYGIKVVSGGTVELSEVEATDNYTYGTHLEGSIINISQGTFSGNGSEAEDNPTGYGLEIVSAGRVSLYDIEANNNQLFGADIQAGDTVTVTQGFFSGHQSYEFNPCRQTVNYYGYGLQVVTTAGSIVVDSVEASYNNLWGARLVGPDISISNSVFNNNVTQSQVFIDDTGLIVESAGNVNIYNVHANENRLTGATIQAAGDVFIGNSVFSGNQGITCQDQHCQKVVYNGYGLNVVSGGNVELYDVTASDNYLFGAHLEGSTVSIFNSTFNNNGSGDKTQVTGRGLEVISTGQVTLMNVDASYNELFGANIQADGPVTVISSIFAGNNYYSYSPCRGTSTGGYGLKVVSTSDIMLGAADDTSGFGVQAYDNGAEGVILQGPSTISVANSSVHDNGADGLNITANGGNVTLNNITASANGGDGMDITGVCTNSLVVNGSTFSNNGQYGIRTKNITYSPDGTQILGGNGSGNVFQSSTCVTSNGSGGQSGQDSHTSGWWSHSNNYNHHRR
jgi:hypothetical protein